MQMTPKPWYRQPWLWFLLVPIMASVVVGTSFLVVSYVTFDGTVREDYRKEAKDIVAVTDKLDRAKVMQLSAEVLIDNKLGTLLVTTNQELPGKMVLEIVQPTDVHGDEQVALSTLGRGSYTANLPKPLSGKRYLILRPQSDEWRVQGTAYPPYDQPVTLIGESLY
ncbi:FixH family protein [Balneatrix alpica]|uniref:FixH family protein n=1 Tax=Balneatrix alpica TaxID=75684 RepID=UPI0027388331|nr:FixH family protein [Balneatrix alpica]